MVDRLGVADVDAPFIPDLHPNVEPGETGLSCAAATGTIA
jgi:hypothetical protein